MTQSESIYVKAYHHLADQPYTFGPFSPRTDDATELVKQLAVTGVYEQVLIEYEKPTEYQVLLDGKVISTGSIPR